MIIRKLADAIREQNWFTVVIEILIVVIGIFLGLQVTDWNEARQDRIQEQIYLERMAQDLDRDYNNLSTGLKFTTFRHQEATYVLNSQDFNTIEPCRFIFAAFISTFFGQPVINRQTFDEMVSSGRLTLLRSNPLKDALGQYYAYEGQLNRTHDIAHTISNNNYAAHVPYISVEWSRMGADPETLGALLNADSLDGYPPTCDAMPLEKIIERHAGIWQNPEVSGWSGVLAASQLAVAQNYVTAIKYNRAARALVALELGETMPNNDEETR